MRCSNCTGGCTEKDFVHNVFVVGLKCEEKSKATVLKGLSIISGLNLSEEFLTTHSDNVFLCKKCGSLFAQLYKFYSQFMEATVTGSFIKKLMSVKSEKSIRPKVGQSSSMWDSSDDEAGAFERAFAEPPPKPKTKRAAAPKRKQEPAEVEVIPANLIEVIDPNKPNEKTYKCNECEAVFEDLWEWLSHIESHPVGLEVIKKPKDKQRPREKSLCTLCGKLFACLESHMQGSHFEKDYKCGTCGKAFSSLRQVERHITHVHVIEKDVYPCRHCGKLYQEQRKLTNLHIYSTKITLFFK